MGSHRPYQYKFELISFPSPFQVRERHKSRERCLRTPAVDQFVNHKTTLKTSAFYANTYNWSRRARNHSRTMATQFQWQLWQANARRLAVREADVRCRQFADRLTLIFVARTMAVVTALQLTWCLPRLTMATAIMIAMLMTIVVVVAFNCSRNVCYGINIVVASNWQLVIPFSSFPVFHLILFYFALVTFVYFNELVSRWLSHWLIYFKLSVFLVV